MKDCLKVRQTEVERSWGNRECHGSVNILRGAKGPVSPTRKFEERKKRKKFGCDRSFITFPQGKSNLKNSQQNPRFLPATQ